MLGLEEGGSKDENTSSVQGGYLSFLYLRHLRIRDLQRTVSLKLFSDSWEFFAIGLCVVNSVYSLVTVFIDARGLLHTVCDSCFSVWGF